MYLGTNNKNFFQKLGTDQLEMTAKDSDLGQLDYGNRTGLGKETQHKNVSVTIFSREREVLRPLHW